MKITELCGGDAKIAIVGSIHGNELIGKRVIEQLAKDKNPKARIKLIIANEEAIRIGKRFVDEDGNRCFPGRSNGNIEQKLASRLLKELKGYTNVIDIHSTYADMADTIIITNKRSIRLARMVPIRKVVIMGRTIAKGGALIDYPDSAISLEFSRKRSTNHVLKILKATIDNVVKAQSAPTKKEFYLVNGFLNGKGKPFKIKNYRLVRKGMPIAVNGKEKRFSNDNFYPIFLGEKGYKNALCMKATRFNP